MSHQQSNPSRDSQQQSQKGAGSRIPPPGEEEIAHIALVAETAAQLMPSILAKRKEMEEISQRITGLSEENNKLKEKLKTVKKDNTTMNTKIGRQEEIIRELESSQEKLKKELESVKKAKEQLRIEIEEKNSMFCMENKTLREKLEALTKEFADVENENKELKRTLESIREDNKQLRDEMEKLKAEHKEMSAKLESKETRLALGQVAWMLEAEIWKTVLPDRNMGTTRILKSMEGWLKKKSTTKEGKAAQKRWDELKAKLNWDEDDHKGALSCLKKLRICDAHPQDVDLEEARKQLNEGNYVAETDKESCEDIINMVETVKQLNNSK